MSFRSAAKWCLIGAALTMGVVLILREVDARRSSAHPVGESRLEGPREVLEGGETPAYFSYVGTVRGAPKVAAKCGGKILWTYSVVRSGANFMRLHFTDIRDIAKKQYCVVVRDGQYGLKLTYEGKEFSRGHDFWGNAVKGDRVTVQVLADSLPLQLHFTVKEVAFQSSAQAKVESIFQDEPAWQDIQVLPARSPAILKNARAVAKITFIDEDGTESCTGFMISRDHFVTNDHCISSEAECSSAEILFGYEKQMDGSAEWQESFHCVKVVSHDQKLDASILLLDGAAGRSDKWGSVSLSNRAPLKGESLYIIEHPNGEPKVLIEKGCAVSTVNAPGEFGGNSDFGHTCDTEVGSSGSPVFDSTHGVIGLHHLGFIREDSRWKRENRAVSMDLLSRGLLGGR